MKQFLMSKRLNWPLLAGLLAGMLGLLFATQLTLAQDDDAPEAPVIPTQDCQECHLDVASHWESSPHAHAFDDAAFQAQWASLGQPDECLACHTTNFIRSTGEYEGTGITCQACHILPETEHPPAEVPVLADTEYCGKCHTTTLGEWRLTGHAKVDIGCMNCHDPHSQDTLFEEPDDVCTSCHAEEDPLLKEHPDVLDNLENVGCVDCHTLTIPHSFQQNYQDMSVFAKGFDCETTVANLSKSHEFIPGIGAGLTETPRSWPIVHAVTPSSYSLNCRDCHDPEEGQLDFAALDYEPERIEALTWNEYPAITAEQSDQLVAKPTSSQGWIGWLGGLIGIFAVFELTVTRKMKDE